MVRDGQDVKNLPADAIITPSARDFLHELQTNGGAKKERPVPTRPAATNCRRPRKN